MQAGEGRERRLNGWGMGDRSMRTRVPGVGPVLVLVMRKNSLYTAASVARVSIKAGLGEFRVSLIFSAVIASPYLTTT